MGQHSGQLNAYQSMMVGLEDNKHYYDDQGREYYFDRLVMKRDVPKFIFHRFEGDRKVTFSLIGLSKLMR